MAQAIHSSIEDDEPRFDVQKGSQIVNRAPRVSLFTLQALRKQQSGARTYFQRRLQKRPPRRGTLAHICCHPTKFSSTQTAMTLCMSSVLADKKAFTFDG
jgi:hypothetical protein